MYDGVCFRNKYGYMLQYLKTDISTVWLALTSNRLMMCINWNWHMSMAFIDLKLIGEYFYDMTYPEVWIYVKNNWLASFV